MENREKSKKENPATSIDEVQNGSHESAHTSSPSSISIDTENSNLAINGTINDIFDSPGRLLSLASLTPEPALPEAYLVHNIVSLTPEDDCTVTSEKCNCMTATKSKQNKIIKDVFVLLFFIAIVCLVVVLVREEDVNEFEKKYKELRNIIAPISGGYEIFDSQSPHRHQNRIDALNWMVKNDTIILHDEWKIKQRYVMVLLYFSTKGQHWYKQLHFLSSFDECSWNEAWVEGSEGRNFSEYNKIKGVICNNDGRVTELRLYWNNLYGTLPHEIVILNETLRSLNMIGGSISSTIPETFGDLSNLNYLILAENCFTGTVPRSLNKLNLEFLLLHGNIHLSGSLNSFTNAINIFADCGSCPGSQELIECDFCECCESTSFTCCDHKGAFKYSYLNLQSNPVTGEPFSFSRDCVSEKSHKWRQKECPCIFQDVDDYYPKCTTICN
mmetsp:Transcript_7321/g.10468  ORF Transcript_7321/g.10468 Transcript_7321/m.10468 type:complete len:443 (+) Transcript_7321:162-1490(+)